MPNPTLDKITRNIILLKNGDSSMAERMSRSDRDSDLLAEWFQNPLKTRLTRLTLVKQAPDATC
jgi:hypothetical protein